MLGSFAMRKGLYYFLLPAAFAIVAVTQPVRAQVALRVESAEDAQLNVDGQLSEWKRIRFGSYGDGVRIALAHDKRGLFLAAEIDDERKIAGARCGQQSDAVVLSLQRPAAGAAALQVWLCPGEQRRAATATLRTSKGFGRLGGAKVVEMDRSGGFSLEAFVPWRALPEGNRWEEYEGVVGVNDVDAELKPKAKSVGRVPDLKGNRFSGAPLLDMHFLGGTDGLLFTFLQHQGSGAGARALDRWSNLHGDAQRERIVIVGNQALIMGPGYRKGDNYDVMRLPIDSGSDVVKAEFADITADGRDELLLWLRQSAGSNSRTIVMGFRFTKEPFEKVLSLEVRRQSEGKTLSCDILLPKKRGASLTQPSCESSNFGASDYRRWGGSDAIEIIKPWEGAVSRVFEWQKDAFRMAEKKSDKPQTPSPAIKENSGQAPTHTSPPLQGRVSVADLMKAFKKAAGLSASARPDDAITHDVVGDNRAEKVFRFGQQVAVMGEGYLDGRRWFHYTIPAQSPADVRKLRVHDVTGNGKGELIFEFVQRIGEVERVLLAVHCLGYKGFPRILLVEIERRQGRRVVSNRVSFRGKGSGSLVIEPGKAKGWNKGNWTFADNSDEVQPLLLPWRDEKARYRFVRGKGLEITK